MHTDDLIHLRGRVLEPGGGPFIFGILNVTPDSFSDGGRYRSIEEAVNTACCMADEGADAIDVGGESTRPGAQPVPADEQIRRTEPVIRELARRLGPDGPAISIDTRHAAVAAAALDAGATIVNDVSALRDDPGLGSLIARRGAGVVLMHMKGNPATMQNNPTYDDVVGEVREFLAERIDAAVDAGIPRTRILVDPGIGFGKTTLHNLKILGRIDAFRELGLPLLVGPSRKRFVGDVLGIDDSTKRIWGTSAAVSACVLAGVECLRVHDVAACRQVADLCSAIRTGAT